MIKIIPSYMVWKGMPVKYSFTCPKCECHSKTDINFSLSKEVVVCNNCDYVAEVKEINFLKTM